VTHLHIHARVTNSRGCNEALTPETQVLANPVLLMNSTQLDFVKQPLSSNGEMTVIRLEGRLILETVSRFLPAMRAEDAPALVLDMRDVRFMDSAGVGALVQIFVHRRGQGQEFLIAGLTQQARAVLEVAGLLKLLPTYESVQAAMDRRVSKEATS